MSGHSKWAQIKHKKAVTDAKRSRIFSKLAAGISVAAREKGGIPEQNPKLKMVIEKARSLNMPQENISRAIARGTDALPGTAIEEMTYEAYGPGGIAILIQTLTENKNRTLAEVRHLLAEHGGKLAEAGAVRWMFEEKGRLAIPLEYWNEEVELAAMDLGAEEITKEDGEMAVYLPQECLEGARNALGAKGQGITASRELVPKNVVVVSEPSTKASLEKLYEVLDEHDDVSEIFSNAHFK